MTDKQKCPLKNFHQNYTNYKINFWFYIQIYSLTVYLSHIFCKCPLARATESFTFKKIHSLLFYVYRYGCAELVTLCFRTRWLSKSCRHFYALTFACQTALIYVVTRKNSLRNPLPNQWTIVVLYIKVSSKVQQYQPIK